MEVGWGISKGSERNVQGLLQQLGKSQKVAQEAEITGHSPLPQKSFPRHPGSKWKSLNKPILQGIDGLTPAVLPQSTWCPPSSLHDVIIIRAKRLSIFWDMALDRVHGWRDYRKKINLCIMECLLGPQYHTSLMGEPGRCKLLPPDSTPQSDLQSRRI